jgi:hypothetical protein
LTRFLFGNRFGNIAVHNTTSESESSLDGSLLDDPLLDELLRLDELLLEATPCS